MVDFNFPLLLQMLFVVFIVVTQKVSLLAHKTPLPPENGAPSQRCR